LAGRQHGVITRRQLLDLGFSEEAIEHRLARGRLHTIHKGVYAIGWPELTPERCWMAATLACGQGAALSHRSAGALWGINREGAWIDVSVRHSVERRQAGIRVRRRSSLPANDITPRNGILVTRPSRTLLDLASELGPSALERAVNEADKHDLVSPDELREALTSFTGEPGVRPLRRLLDRYAFRLSDSDLEILFRPVAESVGLPPPQTKARVNGFEVDFFWPELGLVVETDGLRYHRTHGSQARDRLRDQTHTAAGLTNLRFTHWQVKHAPAHVRRVLARTARNLEAASSAPLSEFSPRERGK
jgi:Transcriptional regulator, AbiEi antitoxin/Protein of unknown function (DUF559)